MSNDVEGPFNKLRVLELGHIVAGPTASLIFADLGADVIKIERPGSGDQARLNEGNQGHFLAYNSNKRSVAIDLKTELGVNVFRRLLATADIVVDNFAPGALERLGLGFDDMARINPRIIHCALKGFLPGPYADRPLTDEPAQMMGGLAYMTGPQGRPLRAGTSVVDLTAALFAVIAIQTALYERQQTGRGKQVHVGLFESAVFLVSQHIARSGLSGEAPIPMPERGMGRHLGWAIYRIFQVKENRQVFVGVLSDAQWERFCTEFKLTDFWQDEELRTNQGRIQHLDRLNDRAEELFASLTFENAVERLERAELPFAPVNTPMDLFDHPHLLGRAHMKTVSMPDGSTSPVPDLPFVYGQWPGLERQSPPALGQHTAELLAEIGYSAEEITEIQSKGDKV
jgi:crotonobetainyl-CoA:carnitine CoA-transferase CaiB-like acyl-CoA transferase